MALTRLLSMVVHQHDTDPQPIGLLNKLMSVAPEPIDNHTPMLTRSCFRGIEEHTNPTNTAVGHAGRQQINQSLFTENDPASAFQRLFHAQNRIKHNAPLAHRVPADCVSDDRCIALLNWAEFIEYLACRRLVIPHKTAREHPQAPRTEVALEVSLRFRP